MNRDRWIMYDDDAITLKIKSLFFFCLILGKREIEIYHLIYRHLCLEVSRGVINMIDYSFMNRQFLFREIFFVPPSSFIRKKMIKLIYTKLNNSFISLSCFVNARPPTLPPVDWLHESETRHFKACVLRIDIIFCSLDHCERTWILGTWRKKVTQHHGTAIFICEAICKWDKKECCDRFETSIKNELT